MDVRTLNLLSGMAKSAGLEIEFPDTGLIRISGFRHGEPPTVLINSELADSELIFEILQNIALVPTHRDPSSFPYPWYINRSYESERIGELAYKARRALRQQLNSQWRTRLWALCAYVQIGCPNEFRDFLERHPENWKLMPLICFAVLKAKLFSLLKFPFKFLTVG